MRVSLSAEGPTLGEDGGTASPVVIESAPTGPMNKIESSCPLPGADSEVSLIRDRWRRSKLRLCGRRR